MGWGGQRSYFPPRLPEPTRRRARRGFESVGHQRRPRGSAIRRVAPRPIGVLLLEAGPPEQPDGAFANRSIQPKIDNATGMAVRTIGEVLTAVEPRLWNMSTVLPILQDTTIVASGPTVKNVNLSGAVAGGHRWGCGQTGFKAPAVVGASQSAPLFWLKRGPIA